MRRGWGGEALHVVRADEWFSVIGMWQHQLFARSEVRGASFEKLPAPVDTHHAPT